MTEGQTGLPVRPTVQKCCMVVCFLCVCVFSYDEELNDLLEKTVV